MHSTNSSPEGQVSSVNVSHEEIAALIEAGYEPVTVNGKAPVANGWQEGTVTPERIAAERAQFPEALNIGIRTGAVVGDDIDLTDKDHAKAVRRIGDEYMGVSRAERVGAKGSMTIYSNATPIPKIAIRQKYQEGGKDKVRTLVEVLGTGNQFVAFGLHPLGMHYTWPRKAHPLNTPADFLMPTEPTKIVACMKARMAYLEQTGKYPGLYITGIDVEGFAEHRQSQGGEPIYECDYVAMLGHVECNTDRDTWILDCASQRGASVTHDDGSPLSDDEHYQIFLRWSRGELDHQGRYRDGPPASFATSSSGQSLVGEESAEYNFWSLEPARANQPNRTIASLITKAKANGYKGFVTKLQRDLSKRNEPSDTFSGYAEKITQQPKQKSEKGTGLILLRADQIEPAEYDWIWPGYFAAGTLVIVAGVPEAGKSTIASDFTKTISCGGLWPDLTPAPLGNSFFWDGEEGLRETIVPRFIAQGGDRRRLYVPPEEFQEDGRIVYFNPAVHMDELRKKCARIPDLKMIVVSPLVATIGASADAWKDKDVRQSLFPLVALAKECHAVVLGIMHLNKNSQKKSLLDRLPNSGAFAAVPRLIMFAVMSQDHHKRRLIRVKTSLGRNGGGFDYQLANTPVPGYEPMERQSLVWGKQHLGPAQRLANEIEDDGTGEVIPPKVREAMIWLEVLLAAKPGREMLQKEIEEAWRAEAIASYDTLKTAKKNLRVTSQKPKEWGEVWTWKLPSGDGAAPHANEVPF